MAIYALAVIFLIYLICVAKKVYRWEKTLRTIHFLAFYAYRAFLANVFLGSDFMATVKFQRNYREKFNFSFAVNLDLYLDSVVSLVYLAHQFWLKIKKIKCLGIFPNTF